VPEVSERVISASRQPDPAQLETVLGARPSRVTALAGATSSHLFRVDVNTRGGAQGPAAGGSTRSVVCRLFRPERWEVSCAALTRREATLLQALESLPVPAPRLIGVLPDNGVVMSLLPGSVNLPSRPDGDWLRKLAATLARIHESDLTVPYGYESWNDQLDAAPPDWWRDSGVWRAAQAAARHPPDYQPTFVHRDYHPVNVLWQHGRISGVVDWINACMGPAGIDVAHCRANLALMYGITVADAFLAAYGRIRGDYVHQPFWDVDDALGALPDIAPYPPWATFGLTGITPEIVRRRLESFVASAVARLA
jgi:hypothetical protein